MEFQEFESIEVLESLVTISEKIHGTNAQIAIEETRTTIGECSPNDTVEDLASRFPGKKLEIAPYSDIRSSVREIKMELQAGSRTRWITPEDDNYGFATWAYANKDALIALLGPGRHFGEWYGSGIGPGYGLKEKRFALFNTFRWTPAKDQLLPRMDVVPILYQGKFTPTIVKETMDKLKAEGSALVPGYKKPEGVVMFFSRTSSYFKQVFEKEDTGWDKKDKKEKAPVDPLLEERALSYLQPVRLEKLMMRDERYLKEYPKSLPSIVNDYITDLVKESEPIDPGILDMVRKKAFTLVRETYGK
jgi:hypothetical protein